NCAGDSLSFSTTAHGSGPFTYQWAKDGAPLAGQSGSSLTLVNVASADEGTYSVRVTGLCNSVTNSATLTLYLPTTADALASQTNCPGDTAGFSTVAHGTGPFSFQWSKDGSALSGETDSSLKLSTITAASGGTYS